MVRKTLGEDEYRKYVD